MAEPTLRDLQAESNKANRDAQAGAARREAAESLARQQIETGRAQFSLFERYFRDALRSRGFVEPDLTNYVNSLGMTQTAVDKEITNLQKGGEPERPSDPNKLRKDVESAFFRRMSAAPKSDRTEVWAQVQIDFGAELGGAPPAFEGPTETEPGLLSKAGEDARQEIQRHKTAKTLDDGIFNRLINSPGVTDTDRVSLFNIFTKPDDISTPATGTDIATTVTGSDRGTARSNVRGRTLIGLSTIYKGPSPLSEYQRLQIEIADGKLGLDEAKQQWAETKEKFWQARATATEKLNREKYDRAIFESDRSTRLRRDESLLSGRLSAAASGTSALVAAAPYLAPKSEFLPGQEPGGSLERLKSFSGAQHTPVRTADASVPFNPFEAADQALAEFERSQGAI
jgi:hypothetical protein